MKQKAKNKQVEIIKYYLSTRKKFTFNGGFQPIFTGGKSIGRRMFEASKDGKDFIEAFFDIDTLGIPTVTKHPTTLLKILNCKACVNTQIKWWAEGRADGTLPLFSFSKRKALEKGVNKELLENDELVWKENGTHSYSNDDIESQHKLPTWVVDAVENQKIHYFK